MLFKRPSPLRAASSDGGSSHPAERRVHCTALPETLVESTLFGHDREAFTGADRAKEGLIKQADGRVQVRGSLPPFRGYRETLEQQYLQKLMALSSGSIKQACAISGLSRSRLYELMKHHQIVVAK